MRDRAGRRYPSSALVLIQQTRFTRRVFVIHRQHKRGYRRSAMPGTARIDPNVECHFTLTESYR